MADNVKISDLTELTSGSLRDATIFPVVDGGTTKKASLSSLQSYLTDDLATDAELSSQVSTLNSTIDALTTDDISEGSNLYYTNARVTTHVIDLGMITSSQQVEAGQIQNLNSAVLSALGGTDILSGSLTSDDISDFDTAVSSAAADAGFGTGGGGGGGTGDIEGVTAGDGISGGGASGTVTVSLDTGSTHFTAGVSASAAAAGFSAAGGGGGGGSTDYISNISLSDSTLTFTGQGNAFSDTIDLANGGADGGNLLTTNDAGNFVGVSTYETDSGSFASRLDSAGGGGAADWDTLTNKPVGIVSSSAQIDAAQTDLSSLTTDDISEGSTNRYYANSLVLPYLNQLQVVSGSSGGGFSVSGTDIVSSSAQIDALGFVTNQTYGAGTASLQSQIDALDVGVNLNDVNEFLATQFFTQGIVVTGSVSITGVGSSFSGSGANLSNIPAGAIVGSVTSSVTDISDGANSIGVSYSEGVTATLETGSFFVNGGNVVVSSGSVFSGSGAGLFDIPGDAILGGVDGQKIFSSSFSASIADDGTFVVGPDAVFEGDISASGEITAQSISVGTAGSPTIYSANNLNLSASNAVVVTDSPLRIGPFTDTITGSFTPQRGDMVYSSDSDDFFGYKVVNDTGSWYSLTAGGSDGVSFTSLTDVPVGLVSSSNQLGDGLVTSSAQLVENFGGGTMLYTHTTGIITASSDLSYTEGTGVLTVPSMSVEQLTYSSLSGPAAATGSFNLVDADRVLINNTYELPTSDGTDTQVIKTAGDGTTSFGNVGWGEITSIPSGIISSSVQLPANLAVTDGANDFSTTQVISASLYVTQSTITDILVLPQRDTKPALPETGSIIVSASSIGEPRPFFYDGTAWTQMFA